MGCKNSSPSGKTSCGESQADRGHKTPVFLSRDHMSLMRKIVIEDHAKQNSLQKPLEAQGASNASSPTLLVSKRVDSHGREVLWTLSQDPAHGKENAENSSKSKKVDPLSEDSYKKKKVDLDGVDSPVRKRPNPNLEIDFGSQPSVGSRQSNVSSRSKPSTPSSISSKHSNTSKRSAGSNLTNRSTGLPMRKPRFALSESEYSRITSE